MAITTLLPSGFMPYSMETKSGINHLPEEVIERIESVKTSYFRISDKSGKEVSVYRGTTTSPDILERHRRAAEKITILTGPGKTTGAEFFSPQVISYRKR